MGDFYSFKMMIFINKEKREIFYFVVRLNLHSFTDSELLTIFSFDAYDVNALGSLLMIVGVIGQKCLPNRTARLIKFLIGLN